MSLTYLNGDNGQKTSAIWCLSAWIPSLAVPSLRYRFLPLEVAAPPPCGDAEACSSSPVRGSRVRGTPAAPLRIFPLTLRVRDSFISGTAAARSVLAGSVHPSTRLRIQVHPHLCPSIQLRSRSAPGKVRRIIYNQRTWQLFSPSSFSFFYSSASWSAFHHREAITASSRLRWVLLPVFSCEMRWALQHWGVGNLWRVVRQEVWYFTNKMKPFRNVMHAVFPLRWSCLMA